jgi:hypothetical protein
MRYTKVESSSSFLAQNQVGNQKQNNGMGNLHTMITAVFCRESCNTDEVAHTFFQ